MRCAPRGVLGLAAAVLLATALAAHPTYRIAVDADGAVYLLDTRTRLVLRVTPVSDQEGLGAGSEVAVHADLSSWSEREPHALALGPDGLLYVAATYEPRVARIAADGTIEDLAAAGLAEAVGTARVQDLCFAVSGASSGTLHLLLAEPADGPGPRHRVVAWDGATARTVWAADPDSPSRDGEAPPHYAGSFAAAGDGTLWFTAPGGVWRARADEVPGRNAAMYSALFSRAECGDQSPSNS